MYEIAPERKDLSIHVNQNFIYKFLKRYFYSFCTKIHIGSLLHNICYLQTSLFLNEFWSKEKKMGIGIP